MKNYNFVANLKRALIISGIIMLVGVICLCIFGVKLDISFKGGTRIQYSYTEAPDLAKFEKAAEEGAYYLKNVGQGLYLTELASGENALLTSPAPTVKVSIVYNGDGTASITLFNNNNVSICRSGSDIVGNEMGGKASQWRIELHTDNVSAIERAELETVLARANEVIEEIGDGTTGIVAFVSDIELASYKRALVEAITNAENNIATASDLVT